MDLLNLLTGGKSDDATEAQKAAIAALQGLQTPSLQSLTLPELQQYAVAQNMSPAQMHAFLQQSNAYKDQNIDQTGTSAQKQALAQLLEAGNAGPEGTATSRAQVEQINQDAARNLAGQRGAIDQQAQARGVPVGLLQAALAQNQAGQGAQDAHMAALGAQSNAYQQALNAIVQGGQLGGSLQGQHNAQSNQVAQAQNAMQQFNAANQQAASGTNAGFQQQANATNTQNANDTSRANTGLSNQRTQYNAQLPQQMFQNEFQKASGVAGANNNLANTYTGQGQQNAGIWSGLIGAGATLAGGPAAGGAAGKMVGSAPGIGNISTPNDPNQYRPIGMAHGGEVQFEFPVPGPDYKPDIYRGEDERLHLGESYLASQGGEIPAQPSGIPDSLIALLQAGKRTPDQESEVAAQQARASGYIDPSVLQQMQQQNLEARNDMQLAQQQALGYAHGGMMPNPADEMCMKSGGSVPGQAKVPGDSPANDTVHARLSPGEFVVPRSIVQNHPEDIASLLAAMRHMRGSK